MGILPKQKRGVQKRDEVQSSFWISLGRHFIAFMDGFNLFLFIILVILAAMQVLFRYGLQYPLPWTEELARFTLVWVTFLGAASVTRRKLHLAVDFFISRLPLRITRVISVLFYLMILIFLFTALWGAIIMMGGAKPLFAGSIPWLSMMYLYLGAVIGLSLMMVYVFIHFWGEILRFGETSSSEAGG